MFFGTIGSSLAKFLKYSSLSVSCGKVIKPEFKENTHKFTLFPLWAGALVVFDLKIRIWGTRGRLYRTKEGGRYGRGMQRTWEKMRIYVEMW